MTGPIMLALSIATVTVALPEQPPAPAGNWQSVRSETYTSPLHPVVTRAEFYLSIVVSNDGSFRGEWGQYTCVPSTGAYGYTTVSCRHSTRSGGASGRFAPGGQGVLELETLGRTAFTWSVSAANELALDLPRNWQGSEPVFHRAPDARWQAETSSVARRRSAALGPGALPRVPERRDWDSRT